VAASPSVRYGVATDQHLTGWQLRVVVELERRLGPADVVAAGTGPPSPAKRFPKWLAGRIDRALTGGPLTPEPGAEVRGLPPHSTLASAELDVVVDLTSAGLARPPDVPLGVWRFRFGDGSDPVAAIAGAALAGSPTFEVALVRSDTQDVLRSGTFGLTPYAPWEAAAAAATSFTAWPALVVGTGTGPVSRPVLPSDGRSAGSGGRAALGWAWRAARAVGHKALWAEVWTVGLARTTPADVLATGWVTDVRWLPERGASGVAALWRDRGFAADPFLVRDGDDHRCLFEALDHGANRGWIAAVDVPLPPGPMRPTTVFANDWHWSYPYVFVDDGDTYCVPETADAGCAHLHRWAGGGWEHVADLLPGRPVLDPSLVRHDGRYWLFATLREAGLHNTELHLFVADTVTGPYRPHRANPVKVDVRSARPGGTIFRVGEHLYRPGQDCGEDYGGALVLHRIDELSEDAFVETPVCRIVPRRPYPAGLHTLSVDGEWVAIDAKRYAFSPRLAFDRLRRLVRR
jgi:hypothetical protein